MNRSGLVLLAMLATMGCEPPCHEKAQTGDWAICRCKGELK